MTAPTLTAPTVSDTCQAKAERLAYSGAVTVLERTPTACYAVVRGEHDTYYVRVTIGGVCDWCTCPHVPLPGSESCSHREAVRIVMEETNGSN